MFIQGNLQVVFDALYAVGAIDPVLKADWSEITKDMLRNPQILSSAFEAVNACGNNRDLLIRQLHAMDNRSLNYIAMEVAREFCEFQDRTSIQ